MAERPFNPERLAKNEHGELHPECFGHCGYGDGMSYAGKCHPRNCDYNPGCYGMLRAYVEREYALTCAEYEGERQRLREQGLDSQQITVALAGKGTLPPTQDAYLANVRLGQLDSGRWHECGEDGCDTLVSGQYLFCHLHRPEDEDESRDGGEVPGTRELR